MVDNSKVQAFVSALVDKFENKVANKKTDISGDFSTDTVSYPTVQSVKSWVTNLLSSYASSTHTHGNISNDGKVGSTSGKPLITGTGGAVQAGSFGSTAGTFVEGNDSRLSDARTPTSHNQSASTVTNETAYDNILAGESTTLTLTDQAKINAAINNKLGTLSSIEVIKIVSDKGTASASTLNKLFIEVGSSKTDVYYTKQSGTTYSWAKLDSDILDDLSISWNDIQLITTTHRLGLYDVNKYKQLVKTE